MVCSLLLSSFVLCFTWVLRGSSLSSLLFCFVFVVFYVGFMAFPSVPICFSIVCCCVLRGFYGLSFAFVFVCAVFYVGLKRFLPC